MMWILRVRRLGRTSFVLDEKMEYKILKKVAHNLKLC